MTLKAKMILTLIISIVLTAGLIALLAAAYVYNFPNWTIFSLLGATVLTIVSWAVYYMARVRFSESLNPKKHKYFKRGNRKESRKR